MRLPIPPAWRQLVRGGVDNWQLLGVLAAIAGSAWLLSPYATLEKVSDRRRELVGRAPNATGRALGYSAGVLRSPVMDPLEVLARRAAMARAGSAAPVYRAGRGDYFRQFIPTQAEATWPLPQQRLGGLGAQAGVRGEPMQASPGVAITAADVLAMQRPQTNG